MEGADRRLEEFDEGDKAAEARLLPGRRGEDVDKV